jgi:hypothetical protein
MKRTEGRFFFRVKREGDQSKKVKTVRKQNWMLAGVAKGRR